MMRASITLTSPGRLGYSLDPILPMSSDALRIAPRFAGICGTDLDIVRRTRVDMPSVLGHEVVASVIEGNDYYHDTGIVVVNPVSETDQNRNFGHSIPGIWTQQRTITAQEIAEGHLSVWPSAEIGPESALAEPVGASLYARALMRLDSGNKAIVLILGSGGIALTMALVLIEDGHSVILSPSSTDHVSQLTEMFGGLPGLKIVPRASLNGSDLRVDTAAVMVSRGECHGAILQALRIIKSGGIVNLLSSVTPDLSHACRRLSFANLAEIRWRNTRGIPAPGVYFYGEGPNGPYLVTGHRGTSARHIEAAMNLINANRGLFRRLISHVIPFEEAAGIVEAIARNRAIRIDGRIVTKAVIAF